MKTKTASKSTAKVTVSKRKATVTVTVTATGVPAGDVTGTVAIKVGKTVKATVKVVRGKAVATLNSFVSLVYASNLAEE